MTTTSKSERAKQPRRSLAKADANKQPATTEKKAGRILMGVEREGGKLSITSDEEGAAALDAIFATGSSDFVSYAMCQLANILGKKVGNDLTADFNAALAFIRAIKPADELEAVIAAQMFATHHLSMEVMGRATRAEMIPQFEANGNMATKLQRTFLAQLDGLGKHRRGGKQIVEHVTIAAGGQAVIANTVNTGGGAG